VWNWLARWLRSPTIRCATNFRHINPAGSANPAGGRRAARAADLSAGSSTKAEKKLRELGVHLRTGSARHQHSGGNGYPAGRGPGGADCDTHGAVGRWRAGVGIGKSAGGPRRSASGPRGGVCWWNPISLCRGIRDPRDWRPGLLHAPERQAAAGGGRWPCSRDVTWLMPSREAGGQECGAVPLFQQGQSGHHRAQ